jgi:hypothetical protein
MIPRNLSMDHIMMDASKLYPQGYHPVDIDRSSDFSSLAIHSTRAEALPKYFVINFSRARRYDPSKSIPDTTSQDATPFAKDVYELGRSIGDTFLRV